MSDYLLNKYGMALTLDELCSELKLRKGTVYNQMANGVFPIPCFRVGRQIRFKASDVATYCS